HGEAEHAGEHHEQPSDLFPCDFFRAGWAEPFEERPSEGRAPRFKLFKSRQGFLERIAVGGYTYTNGVDAGNFNEHELAAGLEWAFNRRFAFEIEPDRTERDHALHRMGRSLVRSNGQLAPIPRSDYECPARL